jgi:hypothetical protein
MSRRGVRVVEVWRVVVEKDGRPAHMLKCRGGILTPVSPSSAEAALLSHPTNFPFLSFPSHFAVIIGPYHSDYSEWLLIR